MGSLNHRAKRITGDRKSGWKPWQSLQSNAFGREPCGWLSQPRAHLSHTDFMPAICNLVTMWLDWKDPPAWQNFKVTYCLCSVQETKSQILTTLGLMTLPLICCHWGFQERRGSTPSESHGSRATGGDGEASTFHRPGRRNRFHLLVRGPPEGQCLFHVLALLQQAGSLIGGQAQKSNLKKNIGRYAKKKTKQTKKSTPPHWGSSLLAEHQQHTDKQSALRQRQHHQAF